MSNPACTPNTVSTRSLRAVLWDMDGTLLESEKLWDVGMAELSLRLGGPMSEQTRLATLGAASPDAIATLFASLDLDARPQALADAKRWLYGRMGELFEAGLPWRPGAPQALRMVRSTGLGTALVTNTERELCEFALDTLGREHFDHSVCGDEVPSGKPDPAAYLRAAELLGVDPADCLAVEDSPTGAAAADAAGCTVLVIPSVAAVPESPRRIFRSTLEGLTSTDLHDLHGRKAT
ncbi:HAD family hydrolase [Rhodococcus xishaensis]|uniref:HAD family phosphatase n=1 Tax=Rhodococcus xishaensis TaxID=2487364 RepID=A0A3S3AMK5_9NOCA|nr:HAD family phosphatase [Rhodococcus xishaensis]RVW04168.1 HAD family phosphatase [Rhodococcus xishaensis]